MNIKLARSQLDEKPKSISFEDIEKEVAKENGKIFCFDKETSHKDLMSLVEKFEKKGYSVFCRELKYGLDENEYIYEVHIL